jgi:hypothetical protein
MVAEKIKTAQQLMFSKKHKSLSIDVSMLGNSVNDKNTTPFKTAHPGTTIKFPKLNKNLSPLNNHQALTEAGSSIKSAKSRNAEARNLTARRNTGAMLLSDYKPSEFGNTKIDLTIDGGQHLRSPGDEEPPKITQKSVQSIFRDPVFDHKDRLCKMEEENRRILLK